MGTHGPIKYQADFAFFDVIDSDAKAYWLGFIAADGTITRGQFSISLGMKDADHLFRLKAAMQADHPVKFYSYPAKQHAFARFLISSKPLTAALDRLGITPNKTFTLCLPPIDRKLINAFVRGYFDGDGSICNRVVSSRHTQSNVSILGTQSILSSIKDEMTLNFIKSYISPEFRSKRIFVLSIGANNSVMRFRNWIYNEATVFLPRKKERLDAVCEPRPCMDCGTVYQPERGSGRFCSKGCYQRWYRKQ